MLFRNHSELLFQTQNASNSTVQHSDDYKTELTPMDPLAWSGLAYFLIIQVASTMGGIGGGTVMMPACLIFLRFSPKAAVAHAEMLSALSCIVRLFYEYFTSKVSVSAAAGVPQRKMLVNFDLVLASLGPSVLGSFIGVQLNLVCPDLVLLTFASLLLGVLTFMAFQKFLDQRSKEKAIENTHRLLSSDEAADRDAIDANEQKNTSIITDEPSQEQIRDPKLAKVQDDVQLALSKSAAKTHNPSSLICWDALIMLGMMTLNPMLQLMRGSSTIASLFDVTRCTSADIAIVIGYVVLLILLSVAIIRRVARRAVAPKEKTMKPDEFLAVRTEFRITNTFLKSFPFKILIVTFLGSFLAAGSSTMVNMVLIWSGVNPFVASSTSLMASTVYLVSATCIFVLNGMIYPTTSLVCGALVLLGTLLARGTFYEKVMAQGKASCILLFITLMMVLSIPANITQVAPHILQEYRKGSNILEFLSPCVITKGH